MLTIKKTIQLLLVTLVLFGCSNSDDNCTTTIEVSKFYELDGRSHSYVAIEEVSCDFDTDLITPVQIEPVILENLSYEVLHYQHAITQNENYEKLKFTIRLTNQNPYEVQGFTEITWNKNPTLKLYIYGSGNNSTGCSSMAANSSCLFEYDYEGPIFTNSQSLVDLPIPTYYVTN